MAEGRRKVKRRVFQVMAMAVRQEYRRRGLARQAMQRAQTRIGEEVVRAGAGAGGGRGWGVQPGSWPEVVHAEGRRGTV